MHPGPRGGAAALLLSLLLALLPALPTASGAVVWTQVGTGITQGVSGIAPAASGWVVVRDNKLAGQNRVALLGTDNVVTELAWPGTAPKDLEAIDSVPNQPGRYVVVNSSGVSRLIAIAGTTLSVVKKFKLPQGTLQNEAFALTVLGTTTVAVWGNRGSPTTPGRLYAATFNPTTAAFGAVTNQPVTVPYPTRNIRHISDAEVIGGRIVISSASDNGNNGPFDSALYDVGTVGLSGGSATLSLVSPVSLGSYPGHKIEAIACTGSTGLLGTDDENLGGWVTPAAFCG
jgi:hypothetical protein